MIEPDKLKHIAAGAVSAIGGGLVAAVGHSWGLPAAMVVASVGVGVGYEVVQRIRREGTPDVRDAAATAAGGALVALVAVIVA